MVFGKYKGDYRISVEKKNGKLVDTTVYTGKLYYLNNSEKRKGKALLRFVLTVLMMICVFVSLYPSCTFTRRLYIVIPMEIALIPLFLQAVAFISISSLKEPITREQKDKSFGRIHSMPRIVLLFSFIAFCGEIIAFIKYFDLISTLDYFVATVIFIVLGLELFIVIKKDPIEIVEHENPRAKEFESI